MNRDERKKMTHANAKTYGPITVDIDELLLIGFDRAGAASLADQIPKLLEKKLAEQGPPSHWLTPGIYAAELNIAVQELATPAAIARTLAEQLWASAPIPADQKARADDSPADTSRHQPTLAMSLGDE